MESNSLLIQETLNWYNGQIELMSALVERAIRAGASNTEAILKWPYETKTASSKEEIDCVTCSLGYQFKDDTIECRLEDIQSNLSLYKGTINGFFMQMHFVGHAILTRLDPDLDNDDPMDIPVIEQASLLFASLITKRYFNIQYLTCFMVNEIGVAALNAKATFGDGSMEATRQYVRLGTKAFVESIVNEGLYIKFH